MKVIFLQVFLLLVFSINAQTVQWVKMVEIIPNPTDGFIQINATGLINAKVQIKNNLGKSIGESTFNSSMSYDFSNETPGVYFILIESNEQWIVRKIIVF
jgi:type IX secretion system substrate protein